MHNPLVLMLIALASVPTGDDTKERVFEGPYTLKGEVLDVFEDNKVLLSFGADQGVRKSLKGFLVRGHTTSASYLHCGTVEFVEVGAKYSVARVTFPVFPMYSTYLSLADKKVPPPDKKVPPPRARPRGQGRRYLDFRRAAAASAPAGGPSAVWRGH